MTYGGGICPLVGVLMDQNEAVLRYRILYTDLSVLTHQKQSPQNRQLVLEKQFDAIPNLRTPFQPPNPESQIPSIGVPPSADLRVL